MVHKYLFSGPFLALLVKCRGPLLRPGSNRPPLQETPPPPPPPPPKINPAFSKEVEFRGYFLLKGIPHFCIFNKKSNFGEWIKLTEKTEEEFEAQAFDLESETLTLAFSGQTFDLTLINPTPYNSPASPNKPTGSTKQSTGSGVRPLVLNPRLCLLSQIVFPSFPVG